MPSSFAAGSPPGVARPPLSVGWGGRPLSRASYLPQAVRVQEQERKEQARRLQQLEERRRLQEAELRRVEEEKERALGLQRRERALRQRLLSILLSRTADDPRARAPLAGAHADLLQPVLDILHTVSAGGVAVASSLHGLGGQPPPSAARDTPPRPDGDHSPGDVNGSVAEEGPGGDRQPACSVAPDDASPEKRCPAVLSCIPDNNQQPKGVPAACEQSAPKKDARSEQDKCNREPSRSRASGDHGAEHRHKRERSRPRRAGSREDGRPRKDGKDRRSQQKRAQQEAGAPGRSPSPDHTPSRRSHSRERSGRRDRSRDRRGGSGRRRSRHRRGDRSRSGSPSRRHSSWNR